MSRHNNDFNYTFLVRYICICATEWYALTSAGFPSQFNKSVGLICERVDARRFVLMLQHLLHLQCGKHFLVFHVPPWIHLLCSESFQSDGVNRFIKHSSERGLLLFNTSSSNSFNSVCSWAQIRSGSIKCFLYITGLMSDFYIQKRHSEYSEWHLQIQRYSNNNKKNARNHAIFSICEIVL